MKRAILVGLGAALLAMALTSFATYLEVSYTRNGDFIRDWVSNGAPNPRYGDPLAFMVTWLRINQFMVDPVVSLLSGLLVGSFGRSRRFLSLMIAVLPIGLIEWQSDIVSFASILASLMFAWLGARLAEIIIGRRFGGHHQQVRQAL
ncbi:MAG: hypothetical protein WBX38_22660 [Candidatus Sulfotelmatobacter sp.]